MWSTGQSSPVAITVLNRLVPYRKGNRMTTTTTCPPLADRITKSLLGYGVLAGPIYVVSVAAQAATREGFDPTRHAASQLANGDFGWIQVATFLISGAMTVAAAVGIRRALGAGRASAWASALIGLYGAGLVIAGLVRADPSDGFPPGTPPGMSDPTWHGLVHFAVAGSRVQLPGRGLLRRRRTALPAMREARLGLVLPGHRGLFAATFIYMASGTGGAAAILSFTAAVVLVWAWLAAVSVEALPGRGPPVDERVCGRDGQRWIVSAAAVDS